MDGLSKNAIDLYFGDPHPSAMESRSCSLRRQRWQQLSERMPCDWQRARAVRLALPPACSASMGCPMQEPTLSSHVKSKHQEGCRREKGCGLLGHCEVGPPREVGTHWPMGSLAASVAHSSAIFYPSQDAFVDTALLFLQRSSWCSVLFPSTSLYP